MANHCEEYTPKIQVRGVQRIPLSLYIHIPWCVKKCPYCDFNSYEQKGGLPEKEYIAALMLDLEQELLSVPNRSLTSIFFGGGTPSLFSAQAIENILIGVQNKIPFERDIEITLEANPGTLEHRPFQDYRLAGVNRISLGAQSFQDEKLAALGRIHGAAENHLAIQSIITAGFENFNIDLMYGLPSQNTQDAEFDITSALQYSPPHVSWYNLTLEPNTVFHHHPPALPTEEHIDDIQKAGMALLIEQGYQQYEVSAFSKPTFQCRHNVNYWRFGDYLGIGAGAHGKVTRDLNGEHHITRRAKIRFPKSYLVGAAQHFLANERSLSTSELPLEFMLNALRLNEAIPIELFTERTGLAAEILEPELKIAESKNLIMVQDNCLVVTPLGRRFLNDLVSVFIP